MADRRASAAIAAAALVAALLPLCPASADVGGQTQGSCPVQYGLSLQRSGSWEKVDQKVAQTCPAPNGPVGSTLKGSGGPRTSPLPPPPDGTYCELHYEAPVNFTVVPGGWTAHWLHPTGEPMGTDANQNRLIDDGIPTRDYVASYTGRGQYQGGVCVVPAKLATFGGWTWDCSQSVAPTFGSCLNGTPHAITPALLGGLPPVPPLNDLFAQIQNLVPPGAVQRLPAGDSLVNLPTCFWLDGGAAPPDWWFRFVVPSLPDPSGRQIYYVFVAHVHRASVDWHWDDGTPPSDVVPLPAQGQCGDPADPARVGLTAHVYRKYSSATGFDVSATVNYAVDVTAYWDDSTGANAQPLIQGQGFPLPTAPVAVRVLQELGVPVAG